MKVAAVVGVGPGIGQAVAAKLARAGYQVALLARSAQHLEGHQQAIHAAGHVARPYPVDVSDLDQLRTAIERIVQELGPIDTLVYNASSHHAGPLMELEEGDFLQDFQVNVLGAFVAIKAALPGMLNQGGGTVLLTGGGLALQPQAGLGSLSLGKATLRNMALLLSEELAPLNVRVSTVTVMGHVQPGTSLTAERVADKFWEIHQMPVMPREVQIGPET